MSAKIVRKEKNGGTCRKFKVLYVCTAEQVRKLAFYSRGIAFCSPATIIINHLFAYVFFSRTKKRGDRVSYINK